MRVKSHLVAQALEGFEAVGLDRDELLSGVGLDPRTVADPRGYIEWATFAAMLDLGWTKLGEDVEQMRLVGRAIARAPSYVLLQRLARTVVSANRIYDIATRWGSPAAFPHLLLEYEALSERRLRFSGSIPEPHAPSIAMHHLCEGVLVEVPTLIGLPPATIVTSRVTPRTLDVVIDLPPSSSIGARLRRGFRAALYAGEAVDVLEEQRRGLAEALVESQRSTAENRELLDGLPDFVMIHRDGVLLWVNRANVKALGYERSDELAGRPMLDFVEPESRGLILARMRAPAGADAPEVGELRLLARDGRVVVVEVSPSQSVSFEGKPARLVAARDVTERVRMRQQLLIADRMASIGMLAAGVAHEVNNPLGYVLNNIEMAIKGLAPFGEAASQSRAVLGVALEGVDRIRTIVRDLLALSRVDDAVIGPVAVLAVVESTLALAGKDIAERAVLTFEHEPVAPAPAPSRVSVRCSSTSSRTRSSRCARTCATTTGSASWCARRAPGGPWSRSPTMAWGSRPSTRRGSSIRSSPRSRQEKGRDSASRSANAWSPRWAASCRSSRRRTQGSTFRVTLAPWEAPIRGANEPDV